jgi:hypothetical protein
MSGERVEISGDKRDYRVFTPGVIPYFFSLKEGAVVSEDIKNIFIKTLSESQPTPTTLS